MASTYEGMTRQATSKQQLRHAVVGRSVTGCSYRLAEPSSTAQVPDMPPYPSGVYDISFYSRGRHRLLPVSMFELKYEFGSG